ncbi:MAG: DUF1934 domain-containing protein [Clostridiales Family XIII bacterium]|jgi:uncharacterized beta-barrel protein YwiB (DUF1934 family)|nr:DUF1934 domain-containing protein [Clostridiales Family XIII bacterium]
MKDIILRIIGNQLVGLKSEADGESMEFITEGRFVRKGEALYLIYEESELSGIEGCTTSLKIADGKVRMRRYGEDIGFDTAIEFEKGKKWGGYYETPFGPVPMEVLTNEIENKLDPEAGTGSVGIDCSVSLKGLTESRNILRFEIM